MPNSPVTLLTQRETKTASATKEGGSTNLRKSGAALIAPKTGWRFELTRRGSAGC
jgi:hypothetical protein